MEVHIVRLEGRPEWICGVYSTLELAQANKHRHQWNTDEIVSYVLDELPMPGLDKVPPNYSQI